LHLLEQRKGAPRLIVEDMTQDVVSPRMLVPLGQAMERVSGVRNAAAINKHGDEVIPDLRMAVQAAEKELSVGSLGQGGRLELAAFVKREDELVEGRDMEALLLQGGDGIFQAEGVEAREGGVSTGGSAGGGGGGGEGKQRWSSSHGEAQSAVAMAKLRAQSPWRSLWAPV
jgi:hypothetical protein